MAMWMFSQHVQKMTQETHATQLQRILTECGVKSRTELLKGEPEREAPPALPEEFPENEKEAQLKTEKC